MNFLLALLTYLFLAIGIIFIVFSLLLTDPVCFIFGAIALVISVTIDHFNKLSGGNYYG